MWGASRAPRTNASLDRGDQTYRLEDVTLGSDFHDDLRTQLTATALAAVAPLANSEVRGQVLEKGLEDAAEKLSVLLKSRAIGNSEHRAALQAALGIALYRTYDPEPARNRHCAPGTGRADAPRRP